MDKEFLFYLLGYTDENRENEINDEVKRNIVQRLHKKDVDTVEKIKQLSTNNLKLLLLLQYSQDILYSMKIISVEALLEQVKTFNNEQKNDELPEITYGYRFDKRLNFGSYLVDLPDMNMPLMIHTPDIYFYKRLQEKGVPSLTSDFYLPMMLLFDRKAVWGPNFDKNLETIAERNGDFSYQEYIEQLCKRAEEDRKI